MRLAVGDLVYPRALEFACTRGEASRLRPLTVSHRSGRGFRGGSAVMGEREFGRAERVAEQLRKELAWVLEREMQDPRTRMVTVSRVEVSKDLSHARAFVAAPEDHPIKEVLTVLNRAAGFLRARLGERVRMRYLPRLRFHEDKALSKASRIDALLEDAKSRRR